MSTLAPTTVVGLRREAEILTVALRAGCHVVLDGPPGTGKSTLLRAIAAASGRGVQFVEGNAELTPARLIGHHDPALVLDGGYTPQAWTDGPLATAMRAGELLYLEELNRIPEETLNVLITAMAEREIAIPRVGRVAAADGFVLVAAMNPFDAVGTARVSQAIADRMCRVAIGYLDAESEREVVRNQTGVDGPVVGLAVAVARASRSHPAVRMGTSVRGAIDMVKLADGLASTRETEPLQRELLLDAAIAAMSGRVRVHEDQPRRAEEVITELLDAALDASDGDRAARPRPEPTAAPARTGRRPPAGRRAPPTPAQTRKQIDDAGRRTLSRDQLNAQHRGFATISPRVGMIDAAALDAELHSDPDRTVALLADMAIATDRALRADARRLAARLLPPLSRVGTPNRRGTRRIVSRPGATSGDLDLERTLERSDGRRPDRPERIVARTWSAAPRSVCLLVDRSGSMTGRAVALAAVAAAAVVQAAGQRLRTGVIAFAAEPLVLRDLSSEVVCDRVVDDLLSLRGHGVTDLGRALRAASAQLQQAPPGARNAILMSDCLHTRGDDPLAAAGALDTLHVLCTSAEAQATQAGVALARRGRGRWLPATDLAQLSDSLRTLMR